MKHEWQEERRNPPTEREPLTLREMRRWAAAVWALQVRALNPELAREDREMLLRQTFPDLVPLTDHLKGNGR